MKNLIIFDDPKMFGIDDARELLNSLCVLSTIRSYSILAEKVIYSFECTELFNGEWMLTLSSNSEAKFIAYKESEFDCIMEALIHVSSIGFAILHETEHTKKEQHP